MSVTLFIPNSPVKTVPNPYYKPDFNREQDDPYEEYELIEEDEWPDLNVSNGNAMKLCHILGLPGYPFTIRVSQVPVYRLLVELYIQVNAEHDVEPIPGDVPWETVEAHMMHYAKRALEILKIAQENKREVVLS